jgi:fructokinase
MSEVVCLGEALIDLLADQPGIESTVVSWTPLAGGAPANVACGLARLGNEVHFIGCVGADQPGQMLRQTLTDRGVNLAGWQEHPTAPTRQVRVLRTIDGDRYFGGFGGVPTTDFADAQLDQVSAELFEGADFLAIGTLGLAYPHSRASLQQAVALAQQHQIAVVLDINWRPTFWPQFDLDPEPVLEMIRDLARQADFIKFAKEEAELLYNQSQPAALRQHLPQAQGIIVTDGDRDCHYDLFGETGIQPAFKVSVIDTTGAGDGFLAGLIHQLGLQPRPPVAEILRYASAAGALNTLWPGAIDHQPTDREIQEFLQAQFLGREQPIDRA